MSENKPNVEEQENDFDLSDMINEYEEDSDLRRKIESMKQEKAKKAESEVYDSAFSSQPEEMFTTNIPTFQNTQTDDELGKTRVIPVQSDGDKTLVIMDNQRAKMYDTASVTKEEDESIFEYDNRQVDAEEITEEDIKEFLGEDEENKKTRTPMDPNKKNKIITYVIAGCISLVLIIGIGFGVKVFMDSNADTPIEEPKKPDTPKDDPTVKDDPKKDEPTTDNSIRIAEIKGEIKGYEGNISTLNTSVEAAQKRYKEAEKNSQGVADRIAPIQTKVDNELTPALENANNAYKVLKESAETDKTITQEQLDKAEQEALAAQKKYTEALNNITGLQNEKKPYDDAMKTANDEITDLKGQIKGINDKITKLRDELDSLQ